VGDSSSRHRGGVFSLVLFIVVFIAAQIHAYPSANHRHNLKAGSELDYPPFSLVSSDGSGDGFSVELLREVARVMHLDLDFTVAPWHELKEDLAEGRLDVLPLMAFSEERDEVFDFSAPYFRAHGGLFVRRGDDSIKSFEDLRSKEIITMRGDSAHEYLLSNGLGRNLVLTDSFEEALRKLAHGQHDVVIAQELVGLQLVKNLGLPNIVVLHYTSRGGLKNQHDYILPGFEQKFCFAVREGNGDLLAHLNEGLAIVIADGTFDLLQEKWFAPIQSSESISRKLLVKYLVNIFVPVFIILAFIGIWLTRREVAIKTRKLREEIEKKNRYENELIKSHKEWSAAMDASEDAIYILDLNRKIITANKTFYRLTGSSPQKAIGSHIEHVVHPQGEEVPCPVCKAQEEKRDEVIVMEPDHPDNPAPVPIEVTVKVVKDDDGKPVSIFMRLHDLSKQRETENALRTSRDEWEKTFNAMSDIVTIQNKDMLIIRANKAAHDFFEVAKGGLQGRYCYEVFRGIDQPCSQCPGLQTGRGDSNEYATIKHEALGKTFYVTRSPIWSEDGQIEQIIHVAKDISKQKKLEEELFQAHKMEAIGTLAGGIAHDFNNILASIMGYSELSLMELRENDPVLEYVEQINLAANRAKYLVRQILSFSRKNAPVQEPFLPSSIIKEALKLMRASLPSSIIIKEEIDQNCGEILADPTSLHQIMVNLCTNALHAIEDQNGEILVKLTQSYLTEEETEGSISVKPGRYVLLSVSDTGVGMESKTAERIFEPYFTTKETGKGTGMGLSVVHGIVKRYNGLIKVESEPGAGTTFKLYFPVYEGEEVLGTKEENSLESLPRGTERIMVVDDEETIVRLEKTVLESLGYRVVFFKNSSEALSEYEKNHEDFDLLITDQTMPRMTGVELCKRIAQISSGFPMIICTGHSDTVDEKIAKGIGIKRYIQKPIKLRDLAIQIREVLDEIPIS